MSSEPFLPRIETGVVLGSYDPFENLRQRVASRGESSHVFCGVCCDVRMAVLVLNGITVVFHSLLLLGVWVGFGFLYRNSDSIVDAMDDDVAKRQVEDLYNHGSMKLVEAVVSIVLLISLGLHGCGIYGALRFEW